MPEHKKYIKLSCNLYLARTLVVISGQAAIDTNGAVVGHSIEEQTKFTLENCKTQLAMAACTFDHVFKVNVYLKDLVDWPKFNEIYETYFNDPKGPANDKLRFSD